MNEGDLYKNDGSFKVCLTGDWGVGKSSLILQCTDHIFNEQHKKTLGNQDYKLKIIELDEEDELGTKKQIKLKLLDTAGQERFKVITASFYRSAHAVMFVYDCTDEDSFTNLTHWFEEVDRYGGNDLERILVGNKCDMVEKKIISTDKGKELAQKEGMPFIETSAKTGEGVEESFRIIAEMIVRKVEIDKKLKRNSSTSSSTNNVSKKIQLQKKQNHNSHCKC